MEHRSRRGADIDRDPVGYGVVHREEVQAEHAEIDMSTSLDLAELRLLYLVLFKLAGDDAERELGAKHRHRRAEVLEEVGQRAGVVLVTMGDDDAAQLLLTLEDVTVVRQDQVDPGVVIVGEHQAGIDHDHVIPELENGHVLADAVKTSQRDDPKAILP